MKTNFFTRIPHIIQKKYVKAGGIYQKDGSRISLLIRLMVNLKAYGLFNKSANTDKDLLTRTQ